MSQLLRSSSLGVWPDNPRRLKERALAELEAHPFREPWWLRGPHMQSIWRQALRWESTPYDRRERLTTPDGDFLDVHLCDGDEEAPVAILLHGLEGCARSRYMISLTRVLRSRGWAVVSMEYRTCSGELNLTPRCYHVGETSDLAFVVETVRDRRPAARIYIAGFSLGGNIVAKWLGEDPGAVPRQVRAAAAISCPFDLARSAAHLTRVLGGLYERHFVEKLKRKMLEKERQFPGILDVEKVLASKTFEDIDNCATAVLHGFRDAQHYWEECSCGRYLKHIDRPTLLIAAQDDPFIAPGTLPVESARRSPYLLPVFTNKGGHSGFVYGVSPFHQRYWAEEQTVRFFEICERHA